MPETTDRELVKRVQRGDDRAFDLLFHRYRYRIHVLISRYISNQEDIEDVVQESFIKAFRALPRFRGDSEFFTWLYRIAVNSAKNFLVARGRRPPGTDIEIDDAMAADTTDELREDADPESLLRTDQLANIINDVINGLPQEAKIAVTLREYDGLSYERIAEIMNCPVGTIRSRIFRAREAVDAKIRSSLEK